MYPPTSKPMSQQRFLMLLAGILIAIGLFLYVVNRATAAEVEPAAFKLEKPPCYPLPMPGLASFVSIGGKVVDARVRMKDDADVVLWWCETPTGIHEQWRAGNFGAPCEEGFRVDITNLDLDSIFSIDTACTRRNATEKEAMRIEEAERLFMPRCPASGTAVTSVVRDKTGQPLLDAAGVQVRITTATAATECWQWSLVGKNLYCTVDAFTDTKGRKITGGYLPCVIKRAPKEGWPDAGVLTAEEKSKPRLGWPLVNEPIVGSCAWSLFGHCIIPSA